MEWRDFDVDDAIRRYIAGESIYAISKDIGVSRDVIKMRFVREGVAIRAQSAAGRVRAAKMTPAERAAQAAAAHAATRGRVATFEERCRIALSRQERVSCASNEERLLNNMLAKYQITPVQQLAVGPYNCDLGAYPVAIEIFGGNWHWHADHARRTPKRLRYFLDAGWHVLIVHLTNREPLTPVTAEYVATHVQELSSDPTMRREYRVIRGTGELITSGSADDNDLTLIAPFTHGRNALGQYTRVPR